MDRAHPSITVIGLGPGGVDHVTVESHRLIDRIARRHLRTSIHPSAHLVTDAPGGAVTHDDLYEAAEDLAQTFTIPLPYLTSDTQNPTENKPKKSSGHHPPTS